MDGQRLHLHLQDLPPRKCWVIGAAIYKEPESENRTILLLKRASHETTFPNAWELPGTLRKAMRPLLMPPSERS